MTIDGSTVTVALFVITQVILMATTIAAVKSDTRVLKVEMKGVKEEIAKVNDLLLMVTEQKGELNLINERITLQGRRIDELANRCNQHIFDQRDHRV